MSSDQSPPWQLSIASDGREPAAKQTEPARAGSKAASDNSSWGKKLVLLVDADTHSRESRAKVMRTLGVTVHCASGARGARSRLESGSYDLVLVDLGDDVDAAEQLVQEIRSRKPRQLVAFLVGSPLFVATSLKDNRKRPPQVSPRSPTVVPAQKAITPAARVLDFGRKVRDAEAEQLLDDTA
jgi:CheY-like chemotaxis protein